MPKKNYRLQKESVFVFLHICWTEWLFLVEKIVTKLVVHPIIFTKRDVNTQILSTLGIQMRFIDCWGKHQLQCDIKWCCLQQSWRKCDSLLSPKSHFPCLPKRSALLLDTIYHIWSQTFIQSNYNPCVILVHGFHGYTFNIVVFVGREILLSYIGRQEAHYHKLFACNYTHLWAVITIDPLQTW